jgi:hypothetical protein
VRDCGEADCTVRVTFADSCGAVATGVDVVTWGRGQTRDVAEAEAMDTCRADGCRIATATCTSRD